MKKYIAIIKNIYIFQKQPYLFVSILFIMITLY